MEGENPTFDPGLPPRVPKGVTGWLLLLCLSLTISGPLFHARIGWTALKNLSEHPNLSFATMMRLAVVGSIYLGLTIFSIWAGVWLWLEDSRAVSFTKAYLVSSAAVVIVLYMVLAFKGINVNLPRVIFPRVLYSVVWYSYLSLSNRVRATFGVDRGAHSLSTGISS
jgi:hypothetical protein